MHCGILADASALFLFTQSSSHAMAKVVIYDYSGTSDKYTVLSLGDNIHNYTNLLLCSRFSVFALVELILTAIGFLFTLALGIIITIGTDDTCTAFNAINKEKGEPFTP